MRAIVIGLAMGLLVGLSSTRQIDADIVANFDGGNTTSVVDADA